MAEGRKKPLLLATILASGMAFIDATALNVALPEIQKDLNLHTTELMWVVNAYILILSSLLLLGGSLGDAKGRRKIFSVGIILFTAGSAACGFSPGGEWLIASRCIQGAGGALMVPGSLSLITALSPDEQRGSLIGTWSMFSALTTILGPVLGGILADAGLWRLIFFLNIPLAALALYFTGKLPETKQSDASIDYYGALLITFALGLITYGFTQSAKWGYSDNKVWIITGSGAIVLLLFILNQRKKNHPLMPLQIFRNRHFSVGNILTYLIYAALGGFLFFLPLNLVQIQGYSSSQAGLVLLPFALLIAFLSSLSGKFADRHGSRTPLIIGQMLLTTGYFVFSIFEDTGGPDAFWTTYLLPIIILGTGMGLSVAPVTTLVMNAADKTRSGLASGINNTIARISQVLAIAMLGSLALNTYQHTMEENLAAKGIVVRGNALLEDEILKMGEGTAPSMLSRKDQELFEIEKRRAFILIFRQTALIACISTAIGTLLTYVTVRRR